MQPSEIFEQMTQRIAAKPDLVHEVGAIFQFNITGEDGGSWVVDLKNSPGSVISGTHDEADCVITVGQQDFDGIMSGELDPQAAFMMGRIKVAGNFMLATKLRSLM